MKIQGQQLFDGSRQAVWDLLLDPEVLKQAVPGVQEWEEVAKNEYRVVLKVGLAAVKGTYSGTVASRDLHPPEHYVLVVKGTGSLGQIEGKGEVTLREDGDKTLMQYAGDVQVGGALAGVGQRMLSGVSKFFIDQGLKSLGQQLTERQRTK